MAASETFVDQLLVFRKYVFVSPEKVHIPEASRHKQACDSFHFINKPLDKFIFVFFISHFKKIISHEVSNSHCFSSAAFLEGSCPLSQLSPQLSLLGLSSSHFVLLFISFPFSIAAPNYSTQPASQQQPDRQTDEHNTHTAHIHSLSLSLSLLHSHTLTHSHFGAGGGQ